MARPPVEWPIPAYVTELRERVIATFRVPGSALAAIIPAPVKPDLVRGQAVVALCLGSGRCLKAVGGNPALATEFRLAEVIAPVYWQGACRPVLRGSYLLHFSSDAHGLSRLVRTALGVPAACEELRQGAEPTAYAAASARHYLALPRSVQEDPWPDASVFSSHEAAEAHLLHPEAYFVTTSGGTAVNAVPVHHYARATTHLTPLQAAAPLVAEVLQVRPEEVVLDHIFFQKRCTHVWSFPPERIPVAGGTPQWMRREAGIGAGRERVGVQI